jgi:PadR family transcriptional regulator PadR
MGQENSKEFIANWESQVKKGVLAFMIMLFLEEKKYYGYELINEIKHTIEIDIAEGTIYPLLNRLKGEGLIDSEWIEMETGIPRKYYELTAEGKIVLMKMKDSWFDLNFAIKKLVHRNDKS